MTKNEYVFQSVSRNWRVASSMPSTYTRLGVHGEPDENMYQRSASAPRSASTGTGSITLPRDFDIFCAVLVDDVREAHDVAVRRLVEHERVHREQRVEPAARLVDRLADEVGGEAVARTRRRSRTGSGTARPASSPSRTTRRAPARCGTRCRSSHSGHAIVTSSTYGRCRSMPVRSRPGELRELGDRADARVVPAVVAAPHRDRRAPVAVARERPVDVVLEPVAEAAVLDVLGVPVDRLVLAQQRVLVRRRAREPRGLGPVDERRVAAPAVRVRVRVVDDLHELARGGRGRRSSAGSASFTNLPAYGAPIASVEAGRVVHRVDDRQAFAFADLAVDLAERGREVHDARAVFDGDEVVGDDRERLLALDRDERERRLVARADELGDGRRRPTISASSPSTAGDAVARHHEVAPAFGRAHAHVLDVGPTAAPMFDGSVHGVVVHTSRSKSRPTTGKRTYTDGSVTSRYAPGWPSSCDDSAVPQRPQYGTTL